jgi:hypothetical protein
MALSRITAALVGAGIWLAPALAQDTPPTPPPPPSPAAAPAAPAAPATTGRIYVSYPQQPRGDFPGQLAIDDAWLANAIAPASCVYFDLPPGHHTMKTLAENKLSTDLDAGATKYVELHIRHMYVDGGMQNTLVAGFVDTLADTGACQAGEPPAAP